MSKAIDDALAFHQTALNLRAHRQQLIASNIANADTPGFKARDFDFRSALANAVGGRAASLPVAQTAARHLAPAGSAPAGANLQYRLDQQASVDGNTVNVDTERAAFAENAVRYEATLTFISGQMRTLQTAINGQ